jgi:hypothetical protein
MNIHRVIVELRGELELLDSAILSIERLGQEKRRTEVRPPHQRLACRNKEVEKARSQRTPAQSQKALNARANSL